MNKTLKNILFIIVGLVVLVSVAGFLLPRHSHVERSIVINAPASAIYQILTSPRAFNTWSPWMEMDTAMEISYFGPATGEGAGFTWKSEEGLGVGRWEIKLLEENAKVVIDLVFGEMDPSIATLELDEEDGGTRVTWTLDSDLGAGPYGRYFGLMMEPWVGSDFEKGLAKLQRIIKDRPMWRIDKIEETVAAPFHMLSVRETIQAEQIGEMLARNYAAIVRYMNERDLDMAAPPLAVYHAWPVDGKGTADVEAAIPIARKDAGTTAIRGIQFAGGPIVTAYYYGPYEQSEHAHTALAAWALEHGKILGASPWEVYVTDPQVEPDSTKWLTQISYRITDAPAQ